MGKEVCDNHDKCMKDISDKIHDMDKTAATSAGTVDGFIKAAQDYIQASRNDIYGKGGLMDRVGNHTNQLVLQWGLLVVILIAVISKLSRG